MGYYGVILPEVRGFMIRSPSALARVRQLLSEVLEAQPANPGALHFWVRFFIPMLNANPNRLT